MAASPPLSPVVTPLAQRKRRHSEMTRDGPERHTLSEVVNGPNPPPRDSRETADRNVEVDNGVIEECSEEDDEEAEQTLVEDILDSAELEPYQPDDNDTEALSLAPDVASKLREQLLKLGPQQFFEETMSNDDITPAALGTVFGLPPTLQEQVGDDLFLQILGHAMVRHYRKRQKLPQYNTIDDAAGLLSKSNKIIIITGAGISTSLGIPDFRSKTTGFYSMLQEAGFTEPEEVFDIQEFDHDPSTFYSLVHAIVPDETRFSPTHAFIRLLQDKGKLLTNYTQNIDNIEERAGIDSQRLIQCHGSFATASCRKCKYNVKGSVILPDILARRVPRCTRCAEDIAAQEAAPKKKPKSKGPRSFSDGDDDDDSADDDIPEPGVMKPDITFFGEQLPSTFFDRLTEHDSKEVDLVIVIGTSLKVAPVSEIPNYLPHGVPHIYISREPVKHVNFDVQLLGDCDAVVFELCRRAGWDLIHTMIPDGCEVRVEEVEGIGHHWSLRSDQGSLATAKLGAAHDAAHRLPEAHASSEDGKRQLG